MKTAPMMASNTPDDCGNSARVSLSGIIQSAQRHASEKDFGDTVRSNSAKPQSTSFALT